MNADEALAQIEDATPGEDVEAWIAQLLAAEVRKLRNQDASSDVVRITREQLHRLESERDNWRHIAASLRARDEAAQRVIEAVVRPGPAPEYHWRQIIRLAEGWRPLARALAELCRTYDQPAPRGWK